VEYAYQAFIDAAQTYCVDLANVGCFRLQQLLERDTILSCFSSCNANAIWLERFAYRCVTENIIWIGWL